MLFNGLEVITVDNIFEKSTNIPKRRSKKKRTQKKFNKKYGFVKVINTECLIFENKIICHSKVLDKIQNAIK